MEAFAGAEHRHMAAALHGLAELRAKLGPGKRALTDNALQVVLQLEGALGKGRFLAHASTPQRLRIRFHCRQNQLSQAAHRPRHCFSLHRAQGLSSILLTIVNSFLVKGLHAVAAVAPAFHLIKILP